MVPLLMQNSWKCCGDDGYTKLQQTMKVIDELTIQYSRARQAAITHKVLKSLLVLAPLNELSDTILYTKQMLEKELLSSRN